MIEAFVRPEKVERVLNDLAVQGYVAATRVNVLGRGKQKGLKTQGIHYDELPKELLMLVVEEKNERDVVEIIMSSARTGEQGVFGDGKIFVVPVKTAYTVSAGEEKL